MHGYHTILYRRAHVSPIRIFNSYLNNIIRKALYQLCIIYIYIYSELIL